MNTTQSSFPISLLRQYIFCPRIPYFYISRGIHPTAPVWTSQGVAWHDMQAKLARRRNLSRFGLNNEFKLSAVNFPVRSKKLQLHGICDALLASESQACPVELKSSPQAAHSRAARIQLVAYALAIREMTGKKVNKGFILFGDRGQVLSIEIDKNIEKEVWSLCSRMIESFESCFLPNSSASEAKCSQCEYRNFCADR